MLCQHGLAEVSKDFPQHWAGYRLELAQNSKSRTVLARQIPENSIRTQPPHCSSTWTCVCAELVLVHQKQPRGRVQLFMLALQSTWHMQHGFSLSANAAPGCTPPSHLAASNSRDIAHAQLDHTHGQTMHHLLSPSFAQLVRVGCCAGMITLLLLLPPIVQPKQLCKPMGG